MTNSRLITRSACALGAVLLATTALQSTPADARGKASGHTGSSARITTHKGFLTTHKGFRIVKETPGQLHSRVRGSDRPGSGGGTNGGFKIPDTGPGDKTWVHAGPFHPGPTHTQAPIPPITGPVGPLNPGKFPGTGPNVPDYPGGSKPPIFTGTPTKAPIPPITGPVGPLNPGSKPPILSGTPTQAPIPPITGPINPSNFPGGNKTPPILSGTPTRAPIPPITGPINPGNYPITPPISTLPTPTPTPVPVPTGSSPSPTLPPETGTSYTHRYGPVGVYAGVGAVGDGYASCQWFKDNYDRTGSLYWLNRYKICLWQH